MIAERETTQPDATAARSFYAHFWARFAAFVADCIILGALGGLAGGVFGDPWGRPVDSGLGTLLAWLYFAGMESSSYRATFGKMLMGLRVTDLAGNRITFGRATIRYFAKIISAAILMIGFLMPIWTQRRQALHDMIAGTCVLSRTEW